MALQERCVGFTLPTTLTGDQHGGGRGCPTAVRRLGAVNSSEGIAMNGGRGHTIFRSKWPLIHHLYSYVSRVFIGHTRR
jgi:hypothetical protein